ncbi:hypothetical protein AXY_07080 [Amphibacillus xylanus NBRC 15112]|uniref:Uncharacterized protein n=1 Tax=Amphibacillus xylanus (strain ATCC 51415 / DSM 6626 / JCM 7361 / LMG 17667 / NBRC 15112 / Ep01) TaxID=698758 RepID=K0IWI7_AMPXN|nr:hypothetical protein AXY_07080 [Amphibacillus xylanus NBRC 15112]
MNNSTVATVRIKLIKIAGKVINTARYTTFKLCSSCLYKKQFWFALKKFKAYHLLSDPINSHPSFKKPNSSRGISVPIFKHNVKTRAILSENLTGIQTYLVIKNKFP